MDTWDIIGATGLVSVTVGIGFIYWPLALVFGGSALLVLYVLRAIEVTKRVPVARTPIVPSPGGSADTTPVPSEPISFE